MDRDKQSIMKKLIKIDGKLTRSATATAAAAHHYFIELPDTPTNEQLLNLLEFTSSETLLDYKLIESSILVGRVESSLTGFTYLWACTINQPQIIVLDSEILLLCNENKFTTRKISTNNFDYFKLKVLDWSNQTLTSYHFKFTTYLYYLGFMPICDNGTHSFKSLYHITDQHRHKFYELQFLHIQKNNVYFTRIGGNKKYIFTLEDLDILIPYMVRGKVLMPFKKQISIAGPSFTVSEVPDLQNKLLLDNFEQAT